MTNYNFFTCYEVQLSNIKKIRHNNACNCSPVVTRPGSGTRSSERILFISASGTLLSDIHWRNEELQIGEYETSPSTSPDRPSEDASAFSKVIQCNAVKENEKQAGW